jgi:formate C-acetyltransferase
MHGRDKTGFIASALSVAKLPYEHAQDGISLTSTRRSCPSGLGGRRRSRSTPGRVLDGYFAERLPHERQRAQPETRCRRDGAPGEVPAADDPRVSGYAVNFVKLTREQQLDVINRTFHGWARLGVPYPLQHTEPPGPDLIARVVGQFRAARARRALA